MKKTYNTPAIRVYKINNTLMQSLSNPGKTTKESGITSADAKGNSMWDDEDEDEEDDNNNGNNIINNGQLFLSK